MTERQSPRNKNTKDGRHSCRKPCHNARGKETYERLYGGTKHYHLKRRYGIGADEFDEPVRRQGGACLICGRPDPEHVDHDHATGAVRGILCFNCNGGLGQLRDSIDALRAAADDLESDDAQSIELVNAARARAGELRQVPV